MQVASFAKRAAFGIAMVAGAAALPVHAAVDQSRPCDDTIIHTIAWTGGSGGDCYCQELSEQYYCPIPPPPV